MKKVAIFNDFYTKSEILEEDINEWIKQYNVRVVNIDIKTYISAYNNEVCQDGEEQTVNCVVFYAVVIYEE